MKMKKYADIPNQSKKRASSHQITDSSIPVKPHVQRADHPECVVEDAPRIGIFRLWLHKLVSACLSGRFRRLFAGLGHWTNINELNITERSNSRVEAKPVWSWYQSYKNSFKCVYSAIVCSHPGTRVISEWECLRSTWERFSTIRFTWPWWPKIGHPQAPICPSPTTTIRTQKLTEKLWALRPGQRASSIKNLWEAVKKAFLDSPGLPFKTKACPCTRCWQPKAVAHATQRPLHCAAYRAGPITHVLRLRPSPMAQGAYFIFPIKYPCFIIWAFIRTRPCVM